MKGKKTAIIIFLTLSISSAGSVSAEDENPLLRLLETTVSFFKPIEGRVRAVEGSIIASDIGTLAGVKEGMRFTVLRKGAPFLHPITKEPIGHMEKPVGTADVTEAAPQGAKLLLLSGEASSGDVLRVSAGRVRVLFHQAKDVDWALSEEYYNMLRQSERFDLLDTQVESTDDSKLMEEAKKLNAHVLLTLSEKVSDGRALMSQRLFRVEDSKKFSETEIRLDTSFMKNIRSGEKLLGPMKEEASMTFNIPFSATVLAVGDVNGDGRQELIMGAGRQLRFYTVGASLEPALPELRTKGSAEHLRLDAYDLNGDGKDEILLTQKDDEDIMSFIYGFSGSGFFIIWQSNLFIRLMDGTLYGQKYIKGGGYSGNVFPVPIAWAGVKQAAQPAPLKLPPGVNIYDFVLIPGPDGTGVTLAYGEDGHLSIYDGTGLRLWRSEEDYGGVVNKFKLQSPTVMVDGGHWSVKDRITLLGTEALVVKRIPIIEKARNLGYKTSRIKTLMWNGVSAHEETLIDNIEGRIVDYQVSGDRLFIFASPPLGIEMGKILKGENPLVNKLYVYPLRVR